MEYGVVPASSTLINVQVKASQSDESDEIYSVCQIDLINGYYNVSVSTLPKCKGKGFASECLKKSVDWFHRHIKHSTLHYWVHKTNHPSIKLAEEVGFKLTYPQEESSNWLHYVI